MKKLLLFVLLALGAFVAPANAQQGQALIVSTCGSQSLNAATYGYLTMDTTGKLCDSASGGGGGGGTSSAFAAAFPATGTAIGVKNGANMVNLTADGSSNLNVNCAAGCAGGTTSNATSGVATSSINGASVSYLYGFNGTTWDQLQVDGGKRLQVTGVGGTFPVTGTFFQATQPVSNAGTFAVQAPITSWAGGTLGAMANYGTSPGAVLVPGVNAFITNTPTVTANAGTNLNTSALGTSANQTSQITQETATAAALGTTVDAPCTVPTTTTACTIDALGKAIANAINTGTATLGPQADTLALASVLTPTGNSNSGITPVVGGSAVSSLVLKASPGSLYNVYAECSAACWLMVFNAVSAPSNGSTTAGVASGNMVECIPISSGGTGSINYNPGPPEVYSVGMTAVISSTTCATLTLATTGFIHGMIK